MSNVLELRGLCVEFPTRRGTLKALNDVSFSIAAGEVLPPTARSPRTLSVRHAGMPVGAIKASRR